MATTDSDVTDAPQAYEKLIDRYERVSNLNYASMYLNWDQQVTMPEAGAAGRARQMSALSETTHELLTDEAVGDWLAALEEADLDPGEAANVREIRRDYERREAVPADLAAEITETASENQQIWQDAKAEDDFEAYAPRLERTRDLQVERAEHVDPETSPYEVMYEDSHPYLPIETIERVFERLADELPAMVATIRAEGDDLARVEEPTDEETQREISERALDFLGYDRSRGRLDTAPHPFMAGNQFDARVTTRFNPEDPMDPLTATIHEFGHATYQLGLPTEHYGTPLGESVGSIHESQSRFWENHVGRTKPFWEAFLPEIEDLPGYDVTPQEAYEAANRIYPDNLVRVEADELTYHMHIILRSEIGRQFVEGDLAVEDVPQAWNDRMDEYLGVRPETDAEGCLQDIHWTSRFAAFQGYTVGSVLAAQIDATVRDDLDVDGLVREGEFEPIHDWMVENVHSHGKRYTTPELIEEATGEALTADYFLEYAREKFSSLYGVSL